MEILTQDMYRVRECTTSTTLEEATGEQLLFFTPRLSHINSNPHAPAAIITCRRA
jgi:hypothetical protein